MACYFCGKKADNFSSVYNPDFKVDLKDGEMCVEKTVEVCNKCERVISAIARGEAYND